MDPNTIEAAIYELFGTIDQMAPGSPASTKRALARAVAALPDDRPLRVVDLGCGTGASTLTLAEVLGDRLVGPILAVERHAPHLERLRERAEARGLAEAIETRVADMRALEIPAGGYDLVWAEGSLYALGFEAGLELGARLLGQGVLAATELVWVSEAPPAEARAFFASEYPEMRTRAEARACVERAGFSVVESFALPRADWAAFYALVRGRLAAVDRSRPAMAEVCAMVEAEIDTWERFGSSYAYEFFVARVS